MNKAVLNEELTEAQDLEMLSDSFLEQLENVRRMLEGFSGFSADFSAGKDESAEESGEDDEDEEDESEYAEVYGASREELKKYVEKFRDYAKEIKRNAEEIYGAEAGSAAKKRDERSGDDAGLKSPQGRGHKMGCGCPGCSAYREFFGIKFDGKNNLHSGLNSSPGMGLTAKRKETGKYEETSSKPCGGRLYNFFHGERAELKNVFGRYTGRFNFGRAGY